MGTRLYYSVLTALVGGALAVTFFTASNRRPMNDARLYRPVVTESESTPSLENSSQDLIARRLRISCCLAPVRRPAQGNESAQQQRRMRYRSMSQERASNGRFDRIG
jgi:hypothetical protein